MGNTFDGVFRVLNKVPLVHNFCGGGSDYGDNEGKQPSEENQCVAVLGLQKVVDGGTKNFEERGLNGQHDAEGRPHQKRELHREVACHQERTACHSAEHRWPILADLSNLRGEVWVFLRLGPNIPDGTRTLR